MLIYVFSYFFTKSVCAFYFAINERLKPQENTNKYKYGGMATVKLTLKMRMKRFTGIYCTCCAS
jgi:hypothetical protein